MSGMDEIRYILEENKHAFQETIHKKLPTKNGMLDEIEVEVHRGLSIVEAMTENVNNLVVVDQEYPRNGESLVHFKTDLVVLRGEDYRKILNILNGTTEER